MPFYNENDGVGVTLPFYADVGGYNALLHW